MNWKNQLMKYEQKDNWEDSIKLLIDVIDKNPNDLEPYLNICYLTMNILVEEEYKYTNGIQKNILKELLSKYIK